MGNENKIKHLEFIQGIINRMAQNSFILKGWEITLVSGLMALATAQSDNRYVLITYFCTPLLWALDGYYLHQERVFRELFKEVASDKIFNFDMDTKSYNAGKARWLKCMCSHTVAPLYVLVLGFTLFAMLCSGGARG